MSKNKCCDEKKSETALVLGPADGKGQKKKLTNPRLRTC